LWPNFLTHRVSYYRDNSQTGKMWESVTGSGSTASRVFGSFVSQGDLVVGINSFSSDRALEIFSLATNTSILTISNAIPLAFNPLSINV